MRIRIRYVASDDWIESAVSGMVLRKTGRGLGCFFGRLRLGSPDVDSHGRNMSRVR
jgi:hypothetical protein